MDTEVVTAYDPYGNPLTFRDAAGIDTTHIYDSTYHTFVSTSTTSTFTTSYVHDIRSGQTMSLTDPKGLVTACQYDALFRPIQTLISTVTIWKSNSLAQQIRLQCRRYIFGRKPQLCAQTGLRRG